MSATTLTTSARISANASAPQGGDGMSLVNLAARQRMLSQRIVLQTVLAAQGDARQLQAARTTLALFNDSQARLLAQSKQLDATAARAIDQVYHGPQGVAAVIAAFCDAAAQTLELAEQHSPRVEMALDRLVERTDSVLDALNRATTTFDQIFKARSDTLLKELAGIVNSIQTVAREAKVVSFNAQVMAARAGQHGREFAVVANVLSGITNEIDGLSLQAVSLAGRAR